MTYEERRELETQINANPMARETVKRFGLRAYPGYKGRKFKLSVRDGGMNLSSYWDGGSRSYYQVIRLADNASMAVPQNGTPFDGRANAAIDSIEEQLPRPGFAVVEHSIFCGKDYGITLYVHPDNLAKMLPPAPAALEPVVNTSTSVLTPTLHENHARDGYELRFAAKPAPETLGALKANGWRWSGYNACWYTKRSESARTFAQALVAA